MEGQFSSIQVSTSEVPGDDILTPPKTQAGTDNRIYVAIFWANIEGTMTLHCKESTGDVHVITAGGDPVICEPMVG